MRFRFVRLAFLSTLIAFASGCDSGERRFPVSGTVTLDGEPLAGVQLLMMRDDGMNAMVTTDANGSFSIGNDDASSGLPAGNYKVGVTVKTESDPSKVIGLEPSPKPPFNPKYLSSDNSGIGFSIAEGMAPITITLTKK